ncbi:MAG: ribosome-associated translation inhibitor RaiA [Alphaproteobacteria bacterium]|jgi:ribosomal subunit interface protein|nr:ribosome-associated translation inhibitor RaiA [Alphaproteobacteria bacterium]
MQIHISAKQVEVSDALRRQVEARLSSAVEKYFANPIDAHVAVSKAGHSFRADCSVHVGQGIDAQSHAEADDVYASIDAAVARLEKQLRRYKRRLRDHHNRQKSRAEAIPAETVQDMVLAAEPDDAEVPETFQPVVVAESTSRVHTLTVGEAVMRMDLADLPVLMFRNSANGELNVVYRRADGHIGWLDPSEANSRS